MRLSYAQETDTAMVSMPLSEYQSDLQHARDLALADVFMPRNRHDRALWERAIVHGQDYMERIGAKVAE